jgi:hypothetical protein
MVDHCILREAANVLDDLDVVATLTRTVEKFSKRIEQLAIIKEVGILVSLAGISFYLRRRLLIQTRLFPYMIYKVWSCKNS